MEQQRERYATKRAIFLELFRGEGCRGRGKRGGHVPVGRGPGRSSVASVGPGAARPGIVVAPGSFFGPEGEGYVRMAMVPTLEDCRRAADILATALSDREVLA